MRKLPAVAAVLAVLFAGALAQTTSTITGAVTDSSGAVLPGAKVTARHLETGFFRATTTQQDGRFIFAAAPVGEYELRAESAGFRPLVRKGVRLAVGETAAVAFELQLGALDQEITVSGEAPPVNTYSGELSYLVSENAIRELPLNGRNYTDLALLQPGVVAYPHRDGGSVVAHGLGASINGQDPRSNVYLLDGTPQNDFTNGPAGSAAGTALGVESIREFRVEVNNYSAEFGRNSGGQINVLTKSGTNNLHGSLYEFLRNDNFDARNFFDPVRKPEFRRNQFGGSLGGPLRADRSFFFFGYEALREQLGRTVRTVVPDAASRQGTVNPAVRPYLDEFPLPNGANLGSGLADYSFGFNQTIRQDFLQGRFDQNWSTRSQFFARYTFDDAHQQLPTDFPQFPRAFISRNQFVTAENRYILSPRTLNTSRVGFSRTRIAQNVQANLSRALQPFVPGKSMIGGIDIGGIPGRFGPQTSVDVRLTQNVYSFEEGLVHFRGRHDLRIGGLVERYQDNMVNPTFSLGIFTFANLQAFLDNRPLRFLGLSPTGALDRYWRFILFGFYLQDNVRVRPRLTLNLGLRYETTTMPVDIYGRDSALINPSDRAPTVGQLYQNPTRKNFSPRFGFAWDPAGNGRTSVRGGYGWFFNTNNQQNLIVTVTNPPATPRIIIAAPTFPNAPFERGIGNSIRPVEWNINNPNVHVWNFNVQQQTLGGVVATLGYAGSRGIHLWRSTDVNIPQPQRLADGTLLFPPAGSPRRNSAFSTVELKKSDGNSWYNAALFELRKRWSGGFSFQSSYTFARNIDTTQASTFFSDATNGTTNAFPEFPGFSYNKGLADYHAKHNWVTNWIWELPLARNARGAGVLLSGWQLAAISQIRSGNPLTLFVSSNRSRSQWAPSIGPGLGVDRPSMAPGRSHQDAITGSP
ncbi:MAG: TonB-dependent receptor, partial [Acidobacteria bacterium]|nr:TonB-dependent receptor [Acidobacteriota bacterium]